MHVSVRYACMELPQLTLPGIYMDNNNMLKGSLHKECATFTPVLIPYHMTLCH